MMTRKQVSYVRLKTWEELEKQYGLDSDGDINFGDSSYLSASAKHLCGKTFKVLSRGKENLKLDTDVESQFVVNIKGVDPIPIEEELSIIFEGLIYLFYSTEDEVELSTVVSYGIENGWSLVTVSRENNKTYVEMSKGRAECEIR